VEDLAAIGDQCREIVDVATHAAAPAVRDHDDRRAPGATDAGERFALRGFGEGGGELQDGGEGERRLAELRHFSRTRLECCVGAE
jgi:hypothetical protein